jgi:hypothetical protein
MSADMSGEQMQAKITAARREAEGLKDRIKRKKDDLADTTRELPSHPIINQRLQILSVSDNLTANC